MDQRAADSFLVVFVVLLLLLLVVADGGAHASHVRVPTVTVTAPSCVRSGDSVQETFRKAATLAVLRCHKHNENHGDKERQRACASFLMC